MEPNRTFTRSCDNEKTKRKKLGKAGWKVSDTQEFLGLSDEEMQLIELEIDMANKMNIKKLRTKLGLTQIEFAKLLGTTQMTISTWENGKCPEYIDKLAEMALEKINCNKTR